MGAFSCTCIFSTGTAPLHWRGFLEAGLGLGGTTRIKLFPAAMNLRPMLP